MKFFNLPTVFKPSAPEVAAPPQPIEPEENFDLIADPFLRIEKSGVFRVDDIELIAETYKSVSNAPNTAWDHFRGKSLVLPDWFKTDLDPMSQDYFAQQMHLWKVVAGVDRDYSPDLDETEVYVPDVDAVRRPGYFIWRNDVALQDASDHVLATGMLMKSCGLKPGMWALEYGAGFAHTALTFARMGVNVDTVDISATFCSYVKEQADFFRVNLTPFKALFGENPREDQKYDLIWFYESFHHCVDFKNVVAKLKNYLTPNGKIILAGEPIGKREYWAVPYPWGLRLESEVIAVIRNRRWFELGFSEDFITSLFVNNGYFAEYIDCPVSIYGQIYSFSPRLPRIDFATNWLSGIDAEGWHAAEPTGRWTRDSSSLALDQSESFKALQICASNYYEKPQVVKITYAGVTTDVIFKPGEEKIFLVAATIKSAKITFACQTFVPGGPGTPSSDTRSLGIHMHWIDYVQ